MYSDDEMMTGFGRWLRAERNARGLSAEYVAEVCGVDKHSVWQWERGCVRRHKGGEKTFTYPNFLYLIRLNKIIPIAPFLAEGECK